MGARRVLRSWFAAAVLATAAAGSACAQGEDGLGVIQREIHGFTLKDDKAQSVSLVGDFNGWNERAHRMQKLGDGTWQVDAALRKGKLYEYAFLVDGKLVIDPANRITTTDGKFSVINIGEKAEVFVGDSGARMEAMQLSLNRLVEQIAYLSRQVEDLNGSLRNEHELVLKKEAQIDLIRNELESARMEKVASARDLVTKEAKLAEVTEKYNSLRLDHQEKTALLDSQTQRVTTMQKSIDEFQTKYNNVIQETRGLREKSQESGSKLATLETEVAQLRSKNQALERDLKDKTTSLEILTGRRVSGGSERGTETASQGTGPVMGGSAASSRGLNGNVLVVSDKLNLLFISVGEQNQVTEGMELFVYRDDQMIARILVNKVYPDQAEAEAKEGYDWKLIRNGDTVTDRPRGPIVEPGSGSGSGSGERSGTGAGDGTGANPTGGGSGAGPTETPKEPQPTDEPSGTPGGNPRRDR